MPQLRQHERLQLSIAQAYEATERPMRSLRIGRRKALVVSGDAFQLVTDLPEAYIDCVVTSPPYWGLRTYGREHNSQIHNEWLAETGLEGTNPSKAGSRYEPIRHVSPDYG